MAFNGSLGESSSPVETVPFSIVSLPFPFPIRIPVPQLNLCRLAQSNSREFFEHLSLICVA